jgi:hypothetical protein
MDNSMREEIALRLWLNRFVIEVQVDSIYGVIVQGDRMPILFPPHPSCTLPNRDRSLHLALLNPIDHHHTPHTTHHTPHLDSPHCNLLYMPHTQFLPIRTSRFSRWSPQTEIIHAVEVHILAQGSRGRSRTAGVGAYLTWVFGLVG